MNEDLSKPGQAEPGTPDVFADETRVSDSKWQLLGDIYPTFDKIQATIAQTLTDSTPETVVDNLLNVLKSGQHDIPGGMRSYWSHAHFQDALREIATEMANGKYKTKEELTAKQQAMMAEKKKTDNQ